MINSYSQALIEIWKNLFGPDYDICISAIKRKLQKLAGDY